MKIPLFGQRKTGRYVGGLLETYARAAGIISAVQLLGVLVILFTTSIAPFASHYGLTWLSFPLYIAVAIVGMVVLMCVVYVVAIPSVYDFANQQSWKHNNPIRRKLELMERNQKRIASKLGIELEEDSDD